MNKIWGSRPRLEPWQWVVVIFAWVNFGVFAGIAIWLGGDALNGKIEGGHYYLGEHGHFTEVSRQVFTYSRNHAQFMILTHILAFGVILWAKVGEMVRDERDE